MSDSVQQIKDKLDIIDVIAPYVELKKAGKNYRGKSPFTAEKTPSFYVSPDRGMYYCFSTSQGGDMFTFIQQMEGVDFKGALTQLAQKAGVDLVPEDPQKRNERDRQYAAMQAAADFYCAGLRGMPAAQNYLSDRGVTADTIAAWQIGYAPGPPTGGWREVKDALEAQGYTTNELLLAGLTKQTEGGKQPYDVFRDRIMFPMADPSGRVVAFSGRLLSKDSDAPKYVNSPETPLYKKSELLFGYDKAKTGIRTLGFSLIVEGQFDVVMSYQAGYHNTVAVSGTALTPHHVQLLERLSDKVVLALDADRAGIAAMKKAAEVMLGRGLDVKVAPLPEGQDPADIIQTNPLNFKKIIGSSVHVIEFLLQVIKQTESDPRSLKLTARIEILPFVLLLPNRIDQEHFVGVIAEAIGSTVDAIRFELDRLREDQKNHGRETIVTPTATPVTDAATHALGAPNTLQGAYAYLTALTEMLTDTTGEFIKAKLAELPDHDLTVTTTDAAKLAFTLEEQIANQPKLGLQEDIINRLNFVRTQVFKRRLSVLRTELSAVEAAGDSIESTLLKIQDIQNELKQPLLTVESLSS